MVHRSGSSTNHHLATPASIQENNGGSSSGINDNGTSPKSGPVASLQHIIPPTDPLLLLPASSSVPAAVEENVAESERAERSDADAAADEATSSSVSPVNRSGSGVVCSVSLNRLSGSDTFAMGGSATNGRKHSDVETAAAASTTASPSSVPDTSLSVGDADKVSGTVDFVVPTTSGASSNPVATAVTTGPAKTLCLYCDRTFSTRQLCVKHVERVHRAPEIRRLSSRHSAGSAAAGSSALAGGSSATYAGCFLCSGSPGKTTVLLNADELPALFGHLCEQHSDRYFACRNCAQRFAGVEAQREHLRGCPHRGTGGVEEATTETAAAEVETTTTSPVVQTKRRRGRKSRAEIEAAVAAAAAAAAAAMADAANKQQGDELGRSSRRQRSKPATQGPTAAASASQSFVDPTAAAASSDRTSSSTATAMPTTTPLRKKQMLRNQDTLLSRLGITQNRMTRSRRNGIANTTAAAGSTASGASSAAQTANSEPPFRSETPSQRGRKSLRGLNSSTGASGSLATSGNTSTDGSSAADALLSSGNSGPNALNTSASASASATASSAAAAATAATLSTSSAASLRFTFDENFYESVNANVRLNLSCHLDGKLEGGPMPHGPAQAVPSVRSTLVRSPCVAPHEIHEATALSALTAFPTLLTASQYGAEPLSGKMKKPITKNSWKWKWDSVRKYKYVSEGGKFVKKIKQPAGGLRDLSKLDMWTQLTMRSKHEAMQAAASATTTTTATDVEDQPPIGDAVRAEKRRLITQLNEILDRRILPKINVEQQEQRIVKQEECKAAPGGDIPATVAAVAAIRPPSPSAAEMPAELADALLMRRREPVNEAREKLVLSGEWARPRCYICCGCGARFESMKSLDDHKVARHPHVQSTHYEIVGKDLMNGNLFRHFFISSLALRRRSDCTAAAAAAAAAASGKTTKDVLPSAEQASVQSAGLAAALAADDSMDSNSMPFSLGDTKSDAFDAMDTNSRNSKVSSASLPNASAMQAAAAAAAKQPAFGKQCTKCKRPCNGLVDMYRHMLDCSGDYAWMLAKKRLHIRHRYFGARRRRAQRAARAQTRRTGSGSSSGSGSGNGGDAATKANRERLRVPRPARSRPSDAESIQRMLADLPAKRTCHQNATSPEASGAPKAVNASDTISQTKCPNARKQVSSTPSTSTASATTEHKATKTKEPDPVLPSTSTNRLGRATRSSTHNPAESAKLANGNGKKKTNKNSSSNLMLKSIRRKAQRVISKIALSLRTRQSAKNTAATTAPVEPAATVEKDKKRSVETTKQGKPELNEANVSGIDASAAAETAPPPKAKRPTKSIKSSDPHAGTCDKTTTATIQTTTAATVSPADVEPLAPLTDKTICTAANPIDTQSMLPNHNLTVIITEPANQPSQSMATGDIAPSPASSTSSAAPPQTPSPNVKRRPRKLNECIAMLTGKLTEKLGVPFLNSLPPASVTPPLLLRTPLPRSKPSATVVADGGGAAAASGTLLTIPMPPTPITPTVLNVPTVPKPSGSSSAGQSIQTFSTPSHLQTPPEKASPKIPPPQSTPVALTIPTYSPNTTPLTSVQPDYSMTPVDLSIRKTPTSTGFRPQTPLCTTVSTAAGRQPTPRRRTQRACSIASFCDLIIPTPPKPSAPSAKQQPQLPPLQQQHLAPSPKPIVFNTVAALPSSAAATESVRDTISEVIFAVSRGEDIEEQQQQQQQPPGIIDKNVPTKSVASISPAPILVAAPPTPPPQSSVAIPNRLAITVSFQPIPVKSKPATPPVLVAPAADVAVPVAAVLPAAAIITLPSTPAPVPAITPTAVPESRIKLKPLAELLAPNVLSTIADDLSDETPIGRRVSDLPDVSDDTSMVVSSPHVTDDLELSADGPSAPDEPANDGLSAAPVSMADAERTTVDSSVPDSSSAATIVPKTSPPEPEQSPNAVQDADNAVVPPTSDIQPPEAEIRTDDSAPTAINVPETVSIPVTTSPPSTAAPAEKKSTRNRKSRRAAPALPAETDGAVANEQAPADLAKTPSTKESSAPKKRTNIIPGRRLSLRLSMEPTPTPTPTRTSKRAKRKATNAAAAASNAEAAASNAEAPEVAEPSTVAVAVNEVRNEVDNGSLDDAAAVRSSEQEKASTDPVVAPSAGAAAIVVTDLDNENITKLAEETTAKDKSATIQDDAPTEDTTQVHAEATSKVVPESSPVTDAAVDPFDLVKSSETLNKTTTTNAKKKSPNKNTKSPAGLRKSASSKRVVEAPTTNHFESSDEEFLPWDPEVGFGDRTTNNAPDKRPAKTPTPPPSTAAAAPTANDEPTTSSTPTTDDTPAADAVVAKPPRKRRKNELAKIIADQLLESFKQVDQSRIGELKMLHDMSLDGNNSSDDALLMRSAVTNTPPPKRKSTTRTPVVSPISTPAAAANATGGDDTQKNQQQQIKGILSRDSSANRSNRARKKRSVGIRFNLEPEQDADEDAVAVHLSDTEVEAAPKVQHQPAKIKSRRTTVCATSRRDDVVSKTPARKPRAAAAATAKQTAEPQRRPIVRAPTPKITIVPAKRKSTAAATATTASVSASVSPSNENTPATVSISSTSTSTSSPIAPSASIEPNPISPETALPDTANADSDQNANAAEEIAPTASTDRTLTKRALAKSTKPLPPPKSDSPSDGGAAKTPAPPVTVNDLVAQIINDFTTSTIDSRNNSPVVCAELTRTNVAHLNRALSNGVAAAAAGGQVAALSAVPVATPAAKTLKAQLTDSTLMSAPAPHRTLALLRKSLDPVKSPLRAPFMSPRWEGGDVPPPSASLSTVDAVDALKSKVKSKKTSTSSAFKKKSRSKPQLMVASPPVTAEKSQRPLLRPSILNRPVGPPDAAGCAEPNHKAAIFPESASSTLFVGKDANFIDEAGADASANLFTNGSAASAVNAKDTELPVERLLPATVVSTVLLPLSSDVLKAAAQSVLQTESDEDLCLSDIAKNLTTNLLSNDDESSCDALQPPDDDNDDKVPVSVQTAAVPSPPLDAFDKLRGISKPSPSAAAAPLQKPTATSTPVTDKTRARSPPPESPANQAVSIIQSILTTAAIVPPAAPSSADSNDAFDMDENTNTDLVDMDLEDTMSVYTSFSMDTTVTAGGSSSNGRPRKRRRQRRSMLSKSARKAKRQTGTTQPNADDPFVTPNEHFCTICSKTFSSQSGLTSHKSTLKHISKLSEVEFMQSKSEPVLRADLQAGSAQLSAGDNAKLSDEVPATAAASGKSPAIESVSENRCATPAVLLPDTVTPVSPMRTPPARQSSPEKASLSPARPVYNPAQQSTAFASSSAAAFELVASPERANTDRQQPHQQPQSPTLPPPPPMPQPTDHRPYMPNTSAAHVLSLPMIGSPRHVLSQEERLFYECCSMLKGSERRVSDSPPPYYQVPQMRTPNPSKPVTPRSNEQYSYVVPEGSKGKHTPRIDLNNFSDISSDSNPAYSCPQIPNSSETQAQGAGNASSMLYGAAQTQPPPQQLATGSKFTAGLTRLPEPAAVATYSESFPESSQDAIENVDHFAGAAAARVGGMAARQYGATNVVGGLPSITAAASTGKHEPAALTFERILHRERFVVGSQSAAAAVPPAPESQTQFMADATAKFPQRSPPLESPLHSHSSQSSTVSKPRTKAAMKGYENFKVSIPTVAIDLQQALDRSPQSAPGNCKLATLADIALGNDVPHAVGLIPSMHCADVESSKTTTFHGLPLARAPDEPNPAAAAPDDRDIDADIANGAAQQPPALPDAESDRSRRLAESEASGSVRHGGSVKSQKSRSDRKPIGNKLGFNQRKKKANAKSRSHNSKQQQQQQLQQQQRQRNVFNFNESPDTMASSSLDSQQAATSPSATTSRKQSPPTPHVDNANNEDSQASSYSDRDDFNYENSPSESNTSDTNSCATSATKRSFKSINNAQKKCLIMGRIFKGVKRPDVAVKEVAVAVAVAAEKPVKAIKKPIPKQELDKMFDSLREEPTAVTAPSSTTPSKTSTTPKLASVPTVVHVKPAPVTIAPPCLPDKINPVESKADATINKPTSSNAATPSSSASSSSFPAKPVAPSVCQPSPVGTSTASAPKFKSTASSRTPRPPTEQRQRSRKSRDIANIEEECGMSMDKIYDIMGIGQRKTQRRCTANKQRTFAETWSSDEYEDFHSTSDIFALIQEAEKKASKTVRQQQQQQQLGQRKTSAASTPTPSTSSSTPTTVAEKKPKTETVRQSSSSSRPPKQSSKPSPTVASQAKPKPSIAAVPKPKKKCTTFAGLSPAGDKLTDDPTDDDDDDGENNVADIADDGTPKTARADDSTARHAAKRPRAIRDVSVSGDDDGAGSDPGAQSSIGRPSTATDKALTPARIRNRRKTIAFKENDDQPSPHRQHHHHQQQQHHHHHHRHRSGSKSRSKNPKKKLIAAAAAAAAATPGDGHDTSKGASTSATPTASTSQSSPSKPSSTSSGRRKRIASEMLYYWSSSSDEEFGRIKPRETFNDDNLEQHGWIVGDSHKKLVTLLAHAKGKKIEDCGVKEAAHKSKKQ